MLEQNVSENEMILSELKEEDAKIEEEINK